MQINKINHNSLSVKEIFTWNDSNTAFLIKNYPKKGKKWCMEKLGAKECSIRYKAAQLKLRVNANSTLRLNAIKKRIITITGRKRPEQSKVMKELWKIGKITNPSKKERTCPVCGKKFIRHNIKNHRKTCSDKCFLFITKNQWNLKPHPKGMKGKTHSAKVKSELSKRSRKMWQDPNSKINSEELKEKRSKNQSEKMINLMKSPKKYKNPYSRCKSKWIEINNHRYFMRSMWEINYSYYLQFLKEKGEIKEWEYEPDVFRFEKIKRGVMSYCPDFKIWKNDNNIEYHEVKGWMDKKSKIKLKRMRIHYSKIKLILIDQKEYNKLKKQFAEIFIH